MKKIVSFALALVLVLSLSVTAFAVGSPVATVDSETHTAALPVVESAKADGKDVDVAITELGMAGKLSSDEQKDFEEAYNALADAAPADMTANYFVHVKSSVLPYTLTLRIAAKDASAKLFKDGAWVDLKTTVNGNTISIVVTDNGPLAVFTKK